MRRGLLCLLVLTAVASADPTVRARADAGAAYAEGQRRYLAEDYAGAAEQFRIAYQIDPDPAYLFNIAQAFRFANACGRAVKYYRRFLEVAHDPPNKVEVQRYLDEQVQCAKGQPEPADDPVVDRPTVTITKSPPEERLPPRPPQVDRDTGDHGLLRRRLGLGAFGIGAVGLGAGIAFGLHVKSLQSEREDLCKPMCPDNVQDREAELQHSADRSTALEIAGYAIGGAAIAAGVYLYVTGRPPERVAVVPVRGGFMLAWTHH